MKIKLLAIDLDGTLLTSSKQIPPETAEAISAVRRRRVHVVLTTARPPRTSLPFYRQLNLRDPLINYNGALVWCPPTGKVLLHRPIRVNIARGIIRWARERFPDVRVSAEIGDKWYTDFYDETYQTDTTRTYQPHLVAPFEEWLKQPVTKLLLLGQVSWLRQVAQAVKEDLPDEATTVLTKDGLLHVMHADASKMTALAVVAEELGVPREGVMAIGDDVNDASMIRWAGVGVAMAHGHVSCLQAADHLADPNEKGGVAGIIRHLVLEDR